MTLLAARSATERQGDKLRLAVTGLEQRLEIEHDSMAAMDAVGRHFVRADRRCDEHWSRAAGWFPGKHDACRGGSPPSAMPVPRQWVLLVHGAQRLQPPRKVLGDRLGAMRPGFQGRLLDR